jgi:hypothetical protein
MSETDFPNSSRRSAIQQLAAGAALAGMAAGPAQAARPDSTPEDFVRLQKQLSNWNRWGSDDLELVGREAEKRKRWDFLVTASPAAVPGATGSVLNPIATF